MRLTELQRVLCSRDDLTLAQADELIKEARQSIREGMDPEELLHDDFGLEPDYVFDLLEGL